MTSKQIAQSIVQLASDKKALDIVLLDMREVVNFCDYFVIASGQTDRQVQAIAENIEEGLLGMGIKIAHKQGLDGISRSKIFSTSETVDARGLWVLLDLGDVVIHLFEPVAREFYALEELWHEAKQITL